MNQRTLPAWLWAAVVCLSLAHNVYLWIGERLAPDSDILALLPVEERDPVLQNAFSKMVASAQQRLIGQASMASGTMTFNAATREPRASRHAGCPDRERLKCG